MLMGRRKLLTGLIAAPLVVSVNRLMRLRGLPLQPPVFLALTRMDPDFYIDLEDLEDMRRELIDDTCAHASLSRSAAFLHRFPSRIEVAKFGLHFVVVAVPVGLPFR